MCELKPCPICGSQVHISASSDGYGVECASDGCFALAMDQFLTPELAAQYWNTRSERYMELPVDADGVPIHVGDVIQFVNEQGGTGAKVEVCAISKHYAYYGEGKHFYKASMCRHAKPRTLEDVLREMLDRNSDGIGLREFNRDFNAFVEHYAAEIRELMGASE